MKYFTCILFAFCYSFLHAQTTEELAATRAVKQAALDTLEPKLKDLSGRVDALKADIAAIDELIAPYPRWDVGALGNIGFDFSNFNNWFSKSSPNTTAFNIGITTTGYANLDQRKYFWRNNANVTAGWIKFDDRDDPEDSDDFKVSADAFNLSSLFGYKLSEKWALSALGDYRTALLDGQFNDPGYLDLGAGVTWTPIRDLIIVVHPLNYHFIFSSGVFDYEPSLGAKLVADYKKEITKNFTWKTNASAFVSYEGSDLSNWTWTNSFSTATKNIGLGFDFGLRGSKQEALAAGHTDNPLQSYFIVGISFKL